MQLLPSVLMVAVAVPVAADVFASNVDRSTHRASQGPLTCFEAAEDELALTEGQGERLCRGASGSGPVTCYAAAQDRTDLSAAQSIELCRCARTQAPVQCIERAEAETGLSAPEAVDFCRARTVTDVGPDCRPRSSPNVGPS